MLPFCTSDLKKNSTSVRRRSEKRIKSEENQDDQAQRNAPDSAAGAGVDVAGGAAGVVTANDVAGVADELSPADVEGTPAANFRAIALARAMASSGATSAISLNCFWDLLCSFLEKLT